MNWLRKHFQGRMHDDEYFSLRQRLFGLAAVVAVLAGFWFVSGL